MLRVLLPTFKPILKQIRMLQVAKICCRKYRIVLLFATKLVHVARFTGPGQTCLAASDVTPVYGVTFIQSEVSIHATCSNLYLLQDRFECGW